MSSKGNHIGSFLLAKTRAKSVRQIHKTGNQYDRRKTFNFKENQNLLHRKISGKHTNVGQFGMRSAMMGTDYFKHLPGDASRRPDHDFGFATSDNKDFTPIHREDGAEFAWKKKGDLQLFQIARKGQTIFNCYRCGYPISSKLVAIKCDNWDWRMCYHCYNKVTQDGCRE